jgi:U3 small nucleolar RNA-associated protein 11
MRNAIQRRNHKERAQPASRERWGLLEKRKDYRLRAADHKAKRARLKVLREKAANRNPDEFAFGMLSSKTAKGGGRLGDRGNKALGHDTVLLLKGQDAGYVRTMLETTRRARQKAEEEVLERNGGAGKVRVFVQGVEEQKEFIAAKEEEADEDMASDEPSVEENSVDWEDEDDQVKNDRTPDHKQSLLDALRKREHELALADRELVLQRAKMTNSVGGTNKNGVKYKIRGRKR